MEIRINIQVERWPIGRLIPRITNPRTHTPRADRADRGIDEGVRLDQSDPGGRRRRHSRGARTLARGAPTRHDGSARHPAWASYRKRNAAPWSSPTTNWRSPAPGGTRKRCGWSWRPSRRRASISVWSGSTMTNWRDCWPQQDATEGLTDEDAVPELPETPVVDVRRSVGCLGDAQAAWWATPPNDATWND